MRLKINPSELRQTKWYEFAIRFVFGGVVTVITGLIAKRFGPGIGGLFLAFPAIFPATSTLLEKEQIEKKQKVGLNGVKRGINAASVDAAGAAMGSLGLIAFAAIIWKLLSKYPPLLVVSGASAAWLITAVIVWKIRKAL